MIIGYEVFVTQVAHFMIVTAYLHYLLVFQVYELFESPKEGFLLSRLVDCLDDWCKGFKVFGDG